MNDKSLTARTSWGMGVAALGAALLLSGCCNGKQRTCFTACSDNLTEGIPIITCQPVDASALIGEKAVFYVGAQGDKLTYQWFYIGGGVSEEPAMIPSATQPLYVIPAVAQAHLGVYYCAIQSESDQTGRTATRTREATLGGPATRLPGPGGSTGPFVPVQVALGSSGTSTVCGNQVTNRWARFAGTQTPDATPPPPDIGFRGTVLKVVGGVETPIPTTDYYLQVFYTVAMNGCATPLNATEVIYPVTAGYTYRFTAFFKVGKAPPSGTVIKLNGTWTK